MTNRANVVERARVVMIRIKVTMKMVPKDGKNMHAV